MISVNIVSYNKSAFAINAVQSVLNQKLGFGKYQVLVLEGSENKENIQTFQAYLSSLLEIEANSISYVYNHGNLGLAAGLNYLYSLQNKGTKFIVELNEDMILAPYSIENMVDALEADSDLGLACANLVNGGLYDRHLPKREDVDDFSRRYTDKEPSKLNYNGSNLPYMITQAFYQELAAFDVWNGPPLPGNSFIGIWDESIDPYKVGWYADWDIYNRVAALGKKKAIVENAHAYHYDHCSGEELDRSIPGWSLIAKQNFLLKYGTEEKTQNLAKKGLPPQYPYKAQVLL